MLFVCCFFFFFKQKTAYEMRISDWSSDVCSSDLLRDMIRGWNTAVEGALRSSVGATRAARLALTHGSAFSQSYRSQFEPEDAASDLLRLAALSGWEDRDVRVYRWHDDKPGQLRPQVYRLREIIPLSHAVPVHLCRDQCRERV